MLRTREQIFEFIAGRKTAFIASVDEDGFPNVKAMYAPRKIEGNDFYFTTNTSSLRVPQFRKNPKACVYFFERGRYRYEGVMFLGTVKVLEDEEIKREIWRDGDTLFYKQGVTDPDYCVLRFTAERGRHYRDLKTENFTL